MSATQTTVQTDEPEFQVRFTGLDTLGDERLVTVDRLDLAGALEACEHIQASQELYQLPVDACVWCRTGEEPWHPWTGEGQ